MIQKETYPDSIPRQERLLKRFMTELESYNSKKREIILFSIIRGLPYEDIMDSYNSDSEKGFAYETIAIICLLSKELILNYDKASDTRLTEKDLVFSYINSFRELLDKSLFSGDNESDITFKIGDIIVPFSVKYMKKKRCTDLVPCEKYMKTYCMNNNCGYSLGLIVKDKEYYLDSYRDEGRAENSVIEKAKDDGYLFDEKDVKEAYIRFQNNITSKDLVTINDIYQWLDETFLNNKRINLKLKFHQKLAIHKFQSNIEEMTHCLAYRPRTGKTIIMLMMALHLLNTGYKRILIMTSVPETIKSFIFELNKYYEFQDIKYKKQNEFHEVSGDFEGIVFCSVQYIKTEYNKKKDNLLMCDANIFDECHFHSSNLNTYKKFIEVYGDKKIMRIFASGTSDKTENFYNIQSKCIYRWDIEQDNYMRNHNIL
tara:strand:- start:1138 stop:2421 length:1284 start_codon:yes stop_codon:yes gene_type:complete